MSMTIKDLARLSGYSLGTVSRVLNNQPNVSQRARDTIMKIVEAEGFELNANAKNLKQQQGNSVLAIVKGRANELFSDLVEQIQGLTEAGDTPLLLHYLDEGENEVRQAIQLCREKKPRGLLFLGGEGDNFLADFGAIRVPAVLVTNSAAALDIPNLSSVTTDDAAAAHRAMCFLLEQGHRELAVIGGCYESSQISSLRYAGCRQALRDFGCEEHCRYESVRFAFGEGYAAMERILASGAPVTAVFAMADVLAIGAIRCIRDHRLRVPEDISVMGFDGLCVGRYYDPKLTTIRQRTDRMAADCVQVLREALEGAPARHLTVPYELDVLESVAVPRIGRA